MPTPRDLQFGSQYSDLNFQQPETVTNQTPSQKFSSLLADLLRRHQQLGTRPFAEQSFAGQEEQIRRTEQTPADLIGASPEIQSGVRAAQVGAVQPTVSGAQQGKQTYSEQLRSFGDALTTTRQFFTDLQTQENKKRDDARALIKDSLTLFGGSAFDKANDEELTRLEKEAGLPKGYIKGVGQTLKERELELKRLNASLYGGLTPGQVNTTINSIASAFDNELIVKSYNTAQEGYQTIKTIGVKTKSPADDIAFIYAFAKIMDPNSVVREGEYNTIQKYAQNWAQTFGFKAQRVFSNTNFLSADAKQKMLNALTPKVNTITSQYKNLRKEYQRQIDDARAGVPRTITEYTPPSFNQQQETIRVKRKSDGKKGSIPIGEFDPKLYEKI